MFSTIIIFLITLIFLVVAHEFGHFLLAKKFGVKVLEFGFGIPPRIFGKKIGETLISINWIPLGGFVRLFGESGTEKEHLKRKDAFVSRPIFQRIIIIVAGATVNFLLAAIIFWVVLFSQGFKTQLPSFSDYKFFGVNQVNETVILVGDVAKDSPAEGKILPGDRILKFNNTKLLNNEQLVDLTKQSAGKEISLTLKNPEDQERIIKLIPRQNPPKGQGSIGVALGMIKSINLSYDSIPQKVFSGLTYSYNLAAYSLASLGQFIGQAISHLSFTPICQNVSGPVGIGRVANIVLTAQSPIIPYLNLIAFISLSLAVLNIIPFPALDGGRLLFLLIELITRKKVKPEIEQSIHTIGVAILIGFSLIITYFDISGRCGF